MSLVAGEIEQLRKENEELKEKLRKLEPPFPVTPSAPLAPEQLCIPSADFQIESSKPLLTNHSSIQEKIALFRKLFRGREDVYAERWENTYKGTSGYSPACENKWEAIKEKKPKKYLPLTDQIIHDHLTGTKTIGVYALLHNSRCCFLACDFDEEGWQMDTLAYLEACQQYGVPAYLERSRSGNGGHVWTFFSSPVKAEDARQLGMRLLRQTMEMRAEMDLASYDRFFPSQDITSRGGFGNLIALPLQKKCRDKENSVFVDPNDRELKPRPDQWAFLNQVRRLSQKELDGILLRVPQISVGTSMPRSPSAALKQKHPVPAQVRCTFHAMLSIEKTGLPPWLLSQIKHIASIWNPVFFDRQRKRFSTYGVPAMVRCYEEDMSHLHLPRGTLEEFKEVLKAAGCECVFEDARPVHESIALQFQGELTDNQKQALAGVLSHEMGVLVAPPGAGKTVMGCYAIAERNVPTLILSHRKPILEQWRAQLMKFLKLESTQIGQFGGGRDRLTGVVDLGMLQSLETNDRSVLAEFFSKYGFIVIDECHHIPAVTFEASLKRASARYVLGLTATPKRSDGMHEIITMQCGPLRYRMAMEDSGVPRQLIVRETDLASLPEEMHIQEIFKTMVRDEIRNALIQEDVIHALEQGRRCILLSQRKEHCQLLADGLKQKGKSPYLLTGAIGKKERTAILNEIKELPPQKELLIISTGQYLGEGFDSPQVDTLFLAHPISYYGKLIQYVGRILRQHKGKESVLVYDYVDRKVRLLNNMFEKRDKAYRTMKFLK